jgi:hypothetical protein
MNVRVLICILSLLCSGKAFYAQNLPLPKWVPAGYEIRDTLAGDLNEDGRPDLLAVLKVIGEDTISIDSMTVRPLLILIRQTDGSLKLTARNDEAALCKWCGGVFGDPYSGMTIKGAYFSIEAYGGSSDRWTDITTFRYDKVKNSWFLHRYGYEMSNVMDPDHKSTEVQKTIKNFGIVPFKEFKRTMVD